MDALALLCTLYADGPSTLQRLRGGGFESLAALLETEPAALRERMGWNERVSERFLREASNLAERLDVGWADEGGAASELTESRVLEAQALMPAPEPQAPPAPLPGEVSPHQNLMDRWRELDLDEPPTELDAQAMTGSRRAAADDEEDVERDPRLNEIGLNAAQVALLTSAGINSLRALTERDTFELATTLKLPYTRAQRLQLLASRAELTPLAPRRLAKHATSQGSNPQGAKRNPEALRSISLASARSEGGRPENEAEQVRKADSRGEDGPGPAGSALDAAGPFA